MIRWKHRKSDEEEETSHSVDFISDLFEKAEEPSSSVVLSKRKPLLSLLSISLIMGILISLCVTPVMIPSVAAAQAANHYWEDLNGQLPDIPLPQRSALYTSDHKKIAEFYSVNRVNVKLDDVPKVVREAVVNTEDARFYQHKGIDRKGLLRAFVTNLTSKKVEGASTLTQQVVKNTLIVSAKDEEAQQAAHAPTAERKIAEMKYAIELEKHFSKDQILERYLNISLFSNGVYGIGTAANYYFSKPVQDLTLGESAMLIGLLKNPSGYNPKTRPKQAQQRRNVVLGQMEKYGSITPEKAEQEKKKPLGLNLSSPAQGCEKSKYPYYCLWAIDRLKNSPMIAKTQDERDAIMYRGGLKVQTNLDEGAQAKLQSTVNSALGMNNRVAGALATIEPGTGAVVGMAQNRKFGDPSKDTKKTKHTEINYANRVAFQSGSTFKLFTLLTALESGMSPDTRLYAPDVYKPSGMNYPPGGFRNSTRGASGDLTMREGTARSSNTFFVTLEKKVGVLKVADMAESLGLNVPRKGPNAVTDKDASFTLGTIDTSPIQMASAYATVAAGGMYCEPTPIKSIEGMSANVNPPDVKPNCKRVISESTASNAASILSGVIDGKDEYRTAKRQSLGRPAGGKTGTTNSAGAAWFAGFTPQYATAVWTGDPRGGSAHPLSSGVRLYGDYISGVAGSTITGPIWKNAMSQILKKKPKLPLSRGSADTVPSTVPDVRGMTVDQAVTVLKGAGFEVSIRDEQAEKNDYAGPNQVADQSPSPGGNLTSQSNTEVKLTLTAGSDKKWKLD